MGKKLTHIIGIPLAILLVAGGTIAAVTYIPGAQDWINSTIRPDPSTSTSEDDSALSTEEADILTFGGMTVKSVISGTDTEGHATKTITYEVLPANATIQQVSVSLTMSTGTPSTYITSTVDFVNKTIKFTNLAAFEHVITAKVESVSDPTAYANITFNYIHRLLDFQFDEVVNTSAVDVNYDYPLVFIWGPGTKYPNGNPTVGEHDYMDALYFDQLTFTIMDDSNYTMWVGPQSEPLELIEQYIIDCLKGTMLFSAESIIALGDGKTWETDWRAYCSNYLSQDVEQFYIGGKLGIDLSAGTTENPTPVYYYVEIEQKELFLNMSEFDFSAYRLAVTSIVPEIGNIDF